jgi:hypothetical protein
MSQETVSQSQMTIDGVIYKYFVSYALQNNSFVRIAKFDLIGRDTDCNPEAYLSARCIKEGNTD